MDPSNQHLLGGVRRAPMNQAKIKIIILEKNIKHWISRMNLTQNSIFSVKSAGAGADIPWLVFLRFPGNCPMLFA